MKAGCGKLKRLHELERLTKISITKHLLQFPLEIKTPGVAMNIITQQLNYACESSGNSSSYSVSQNLKQSGRLCALVQPPDVLMTEKRRNFITPHPVAKHGIHHG